MNNINPKIYNLSPRTTLLQNSTGDLFIVINRKSRLIMMDGEKILNTVSTIHRVDTNKNVSVLTSAPVCSKTRALLQKNNIKILELTNV